MVSQECSSQFRVDGVFRYILTPVSGLEIGSERPTFGEQTLSCLQVDCRSGASFATNGPTLSNVLPVGHRGVPFL